MHALGFGQLIVSGDFIQHILDVTTGFTDDTLAALEPIGHSDHVGLCVHNLAALEILNPNFERLAQDLKVKDKPVEEKGPLPKNVKQKPPRQ